MIDRVTVGLNGDDLECEWRAGAWNMKLLLLKGGLSGNRMFGLYIEVINRYLMIDLKETIIRFMCDGLFESAITFTVHPVFSMRLINKLPPKGKCSHICWECRQYTAINSIFLIGSGFNRFHPIHDNCLFYGLPLEDYKKYKPFLSIIYPTLSIDL